jgi:hypothetical protein
VRFDAALDNNEIEYGPRRPPTPMELAMMRTWKPYILAQFERDSALMDYLQPRA